MEVGLVRRGEERRGRRDDERKLLQLMGGSRTCTLPSSRPK